MTEKLVIYLIDAVLAVLVVMLEWVFSAETGENPLLGHLVSFGHLLSSIWIAQETQEIYLWCQEYSDNFELKKI